MILIYNCKVVRDLEFTFLYDSRIVNYYHRWCIRLATVIIRWQIDPACLPLLTLLGSYVAHKTIKEALALSVCVIVNKSSKLSQ